MAIDVAARKAAFIAALLEKYSAQTVEELPFTIRYVRTGVLLQPKEKRPTINITS